MAHDIQRDLASRAKRLQDLRIPMRRAIWLRPQPAAPRSISVTASKIAGMFAWPNSVPWPVCEIPEEHQDPPRDTEGDFYVTVAQFRRSDFPEILFPDGADILQILWCPRVHMHPAIIYGGVGPFPKVFWHSAADLGNEPNPAPKNPSIYLSPTEATFDPLRILDAPIWVNLTAEQRRVFTDHDEFGSIGNIPGTKLLGWPELPFRKVPICHCGNAMDLLFTMSSTAVDTYYEGWWHRYSPNPPDPEARRVTCIGGVDQLDGAMFIFYCETCPERPTRHLIQNS